MDTRTHVFSTAEAPAGVLEQVRQMLDAALDGNFSDNDWAHTLGGWHSLVTETGAVVAHAAATPAP